MRRGSCGEADSSEGRLRSGCGEVGQANRQSVATFFPPIGEEPPQAVTSIQQHAPHPIAATPRGGALSSQ
jgi:hypothetical protein